MDSPTRLPAVFIGHGSPMNTLEHNRYTQAWHDFGRSIATPRAIVAISAHWYVNATAVTAMERPKTIHDFSGFPRELSEFEYPAAGDPGLAHEIAGLLSPTAVHLDNREWGLDHGTWSVLAHMFPKADVPVVQLSIDATLEPDDHVQIGRKLAPLRDQGVLIVASGNVVHNLRRIQWDQPETGFDWNVEFDQQARTLMTERPTDIGSLATHRHYRNAAPTPDHLIPLYYIAGLAAAADTTAQVMLGGSVMGSLSMTSFEVAA